NWMGDELDIQLHTWKNRDAIRDLVMRNSRVDVAELSGRMSDPSVPWDLRALYAAILTCQENKGGQDFLVRAAADIKSERVGDVFWLIGSLSGFMPPAVREDAEPNALILQKNKRLGTVELIPAIEPGVSLRPDLTWAIPTMLAALQDRR